LLRKFDPDAYGKPTKLRGTLQELNRQGSSTFPTTPTNEHTIDADLTPSSGIVDSTNCPKSENSCGSSNGHSPAALPQDTSCKELAEFNMAPAKWRTNKNAGATRVPRKNGRPQLGENVKPSKVDAIVTPAKEPSMQETRDQKLERLQKEKMTELGVRIRQQSNEPTTSPQTLAIARQASLNLQASKMPPKSPKTMVNASTPANLKDEGTQNGIARPRSNLVNESAKSQGSGREIIVVSPNIDAKTGNGAPTNLDMQEKAQNQIQEAKDVSAKCSTTGTRRKNAANPTNARTARWATNAEIKAPPVPAKSIDSNAFGSEVPSDRQTASGDSVAALQNGRVLRNNRPGGEDTPLADWSGTLMPPPVDWQTRPRYNNNCAEFTGGFGRWNETTAAQSVNAATGQPFTRLSQDLIANPDLHPDGLSLVDPTMNVDVDNAEKYGYSGDALVTIRHDSQLIDPAIFVDDWGKLDLRDPENSKFQAECCNDLVHNYNTNIARGREHEIRLRRTQRLARKREGPVIPTPNPHIPRINIYLRPAVRSDIPQLQDIYNSYVSNSVRPAELRPISYSDMLNRWRDTTDEKLPFIVAVSKSAKINRGISNAVEKVVGWASATDWVGRHAIERFTVELEIYIHQQHLHLGVGKCLMDKLIDSTDRGHMTRKGYPFACAPEFQHGYSAGGARDLIKLLFIVRSLNKPQNKKENDLPWIKKWLETEWKFEQQGHFTQAGVKFQR
jgi:L-amino acid N-acyltransferase YncA